MSKKRVMAGLLSAMMLIAGIMILPKAANAEEIKVDEIVYDDSYDMSTYWTKNAETQKVPIKEGFVFGGWYEKNGSTWVAIDKDNISAASDTAYAKFVPAYVLSIQTQMEATTAENNGISEGKTTFIRLVSTVDCLDYDATGYDIWYGNTSQATNLEPSKRVYEKLNVGKEPIEPEQAFGPSSKFFNYLRINNLKSTSLHKIIFARPYWITKDGTKVEGLGKYVRVEDGFKKNEYMSVPINLLDGKEVAAGIVEMKYDATTLKVVGVDAGRILPEMNYKVDEKKGIIRFAANAETVGNSDMLNDIYASVRFDVKEGATKASSYTFDVTAGEFVDWAEKDVKNVWTWDYKY